MSQQDKSGAGSVAIELLVGGLRGWPEVEPDLQLLAFGVQPNVGVA